jgi:hypothetical protein
VRIIQLSIKFKLGLIKSFEIMKSAIESLSDFDRKFVIEIAYTNLKLNAKLGN